jgi:hypothetical protein
MEWLANIYYILYAGGTVGLWLFFLLSKPIDKSQFATGTAVLGGWIMLMCVGHKTDVPKSWPVVILIVPVLFLIYLSVVSSTSNDRWTQLTDMLSASTTLITNLVSIPILMLKYGNRSTSTFNFSHYLVLGIIVIAWGILLYFHGLIELVVTIVLFIWGATIYLMYPKLEDNALVYFGCFIDFMIIVLGVCSIQCSNLNEQEMAEHKIFCNVPEIVTVVSNSTTLLSNFFSLPLMVLSLL